jgi:hypothetical protein
LRDALALWRGHAYADVEAHGALDAEVARLHELRLSAIERRIGCELALGRHGELVGELEALTAEHPFRESLRAHQVLALYRSGRQSDALAALGRSRRLLGEELGIDPSLQLQQLERRILVQDITLGWTRVRAWSGERSWWLSSRPRRGALADAPLPWRGETRCWRNPSSGPRP